MPKPSSRLDKLEALRGFAACYVMFGHLASMYFDAQGVWSIPFRFAVEAVMLFFILSGFVIRYSSPPGTHTWRAYFIKRLRRIYPLFLISLVVSYACAVWADGTWTPKGFSWTNLPGNLLMLQDAPITNPGAWFTPFINPVLWSLSYEWWFYMIYYPLAEWKMPEERKNWIIFAVSAAATIAYPFFPNFPCMVLSFLSIWWAGGQLAAEYMASGQVTFRRQRWQLLRLSLLAGLWAIPLLMTSRDQLQAGTYPIWPLRCFVGVVLMLSIGLAWRALRFRAFRYTFGLFTFLAPISYAIYIFHYPILDTLKFSRLAKPAPLFLACFFVITLAWCYLTEVRLQAWINRVTKPWLGK